MALRLPLITSDEVKALTETMALMGYDRLLLHAPMLYFAMGKEWEGSILKINYNAWNCLDLGQFHILF